MALPGSLEAESVWVCMALSGLKEQSELGVEACMAPTAEGNPRRPPRPSSRGPVFSPPTVSEVLGALHFFWEPKAPFRGFARKTEDGGGRHAK